GGPLADLAHFANVWHEPTWRLIVAWLLATFRPHGPYPILVLNGEQGSAKSTLARVLRKLIDPNKVLLRRPSRDERDLMITATNSWIVALDNLSSLSDWMSDGLCMLATGGGFARPDSNKDRERFSSVAPGRLWWKGLERTAPRADSVVGRCWLKFPAFPARRGRAGGRFGTPLAPAGRRPPGGRLKVGWG